MKGTTTTNRRLLRDHVGKTVVLQYNNHPSFASTLRPPSYDKRTDDDFYLIRYNTRHGVGIRASQVTLETLGNTLIINFTDSINEEV